MTGENNVSQHKEALESIQDAAKQICTIIPLLQAAYFAAISISDLKKSLWQEPRPDWFTFLFCAVIFIAPVVLWLASFILAIGIFVPSEVPPEAIRLHNSSTYEDMASRKYSLLRTVLWLLAGGLACLTLNFLFYIIFIPPHISK